MRVGKDPRPVVTMTPLRGYIAALGLLALCCAFGAPAYAEEAMLMFGCGVAGRPGNVIVLVQHGASSYVKIGAQRIPAAYTKTGKEQKWAWGNNAVSMVDGNAKYFEGGDFANSKGNFRCKPMG